MFDEPLLELGCGRGVHLAHAAPCSLGVDRDEAALEAVRALGQRSARRDLSQPGWSDGLGRWPLVFCADLLVHLPDPDVLLAELPALLDQGGRLLLVEWVWPHGRLADGLVRAVVPGAAAHRAHAEHLHVFHADELVRRFTRHGLRLHSSWVHTVRSPWLGRALAPGWPPRSFLLGAGG